MSEGDRPSFWQTLPGVLTALATIITALTGLIVGVYQSGILKPSQPETVAASPSASSEPGSSPVTREAGIQPSPQPAAPSAPAPPSPTSSTSPASLAASPSQSGPRVNLLASDNGGHLVAAAADNWKITIDGSEDYACCFYPKQSAVYAFKDGKTASFDMFGSFIDATRNDNVREVELAAGNDTVLGEYKTIAKCEFQNLKLFETPYQECKFPAVRAKYLKVTIVSMFGSSSSSAYLQEFRLLGTLN